MTWETPRLLVLLAAAANLIAGILVYTPPFDPVVLVFIGPGVLLAAALARWPARWLEIAAGAFLALPALLVLFLFGEIAWLADPFRGSFGDYLSIVLLATTLLLVIPALAARIPPIGARASPGALRAYALGVALIALGASSSTAAILVGAPAPDGAWDVEPQARVRLELADEKFVPDVVEVQAGVLTEIEIVNLDDTWHTLSYARGGEIRHHRVLPEQTTSILVRFDAPGDIALWCEPHADFMTAVLRVVPQASVG